MIDATEWILGALAIVLAAATFAVGGQVIREAWRGVFRKPPATPPGPGLLWGRPGAGMTPSAVDRMHERIQQRGPR
jgi:hypothetical protein